jgi:pyruvate/2-oxoglutarate dehydrogenase complex dihydrolipoamide dehydrogenase (E3) component
MRAADGIWAMGDVTGKGMFTHVALYQSAIVAAELLGEDHPPATYHAAPRATFTDPEVGSVGMTESEVRAVWIDVVVAVKQLPATFSGWLHGSGSGIIKMVADRETGVLFGATSVGPHGGDMLGLLSLAVHTGATIPDLQSMIYASPTFHGGIGEAVGAYGRSLANVIDPTYEGFNTLDDAGVN